MFLLAHGTNPVLIEPARKCLAFVPRLLLMPRWPTGAPIGKHGQIPFRIRNYPRAPLLVDGFCIYHFDVFLEGLLDHVVAIGVGPLLAYGWRVRPEASHFRLCEG